jgi:penicillin-binding protein 1C
MSPRRTRLLRGLAIVAVAPFAALLLAALLTPFPAELREGASSSVRVLDNRGRLLREVRATDGKRARPLTDAELHGPLANAMIAAEDRRFRSHHGVDVLALGRAIATSLAHRRIVSGASTLTMQLARTVHPRPKSLGGKFLEMALALRIEASLEKDEILRAYLERVDFGPGLRGAGAASLAIFDKPLTSLSTAEAALLAGLPRGPSLYDVRKRPELAKTRRNRVIDRMLAMGTLTEKAAENARGEPLAPASRPPAFGAPHLVRGLVGGALRAWAPELATVGTPSEITTTIDGDLQRVAENALRIHLQPLAKKNVTSGAVVVVENETGKVLVYVGSPDFFDEAKLGQNDGASSLRQPGSTLKPFVYGLAMERLGFTAATVLPDINLHLATAAGDFAPRNYDGKFHGPVRLRQALATSLNIPAVATAEEVGIDALLDRLRDVGFDSLREAPSHYGPGVALGDGEVTLLALARAYSTLARRGHDHPLVFVTAASGSGGVLAPPSFADGPPILEETATDVLTDILADSGSREAAFGEGEALRFPFDVAAKTGTSKGYRDNWTVGFTRAITVAVWVGNFDGTPMTAVSGVTGAGPVFHSVMEAAMRDRPTSGAENSLQLRQRVRSPADATDPHALVEVPVCALSGERPNSVCPHRVHEWMTRGDAAALSVCGYHEQVRIERATGHRAGGSCPLNETELRVFEHYPPLYGEWPLSAERPLAPATASVRCPPDAADDSVGDTTALRIDYPLPDSRFVLDPEQDLAVQRVQLRISGPRRMQRAELRVDGAVVATSTPPIRLSMPLTPGEHTAVLEADGATSEPLHFTVR